MKNKAFIIAVVIIALFAGAFVIIKNTVPAQETAAAITPAAPAMAENSFRVVPADKSLLIKPHSISKGSETARVTIVEFLDPECEACAAMHPYAKKVLKEFEKDVRFVVRYMAYHKNSKFVANVLEAIRAEDESKYWDALETLFQTQPQWANHQNPKPELIPDILKPLGLNLKKIVADAHAGKYDQLVMQDMDDGKIAGVEGTPTFFVNNSKLENLGYEPLRAAVQNILK